MKSIESSELKKKKNQAISTTLFCINQPDRFYGLQYFIWKHLLKYYQLSSTLKTQYVISLNFLKQ